MKEYSGSLTPFMVHIRAMHAKGESASEIARYLYQRCGFRVRSWCGDKEEVQRRNIAGLVRHALGLNKAQLPSCEVLEARVAYYAKRLREAEKLLALKRGRANDSRSNGGSPTGDAGLPEAVGGGG